MRRAYDLQSKASVRPSRIAYVLGSAALTLIAWASPGEAAAQLTYYLSTTIQSGSLGAITLSNTPVEFTIVSPTPTIVPVSGAPVDTSASFFANVDPLLTATITVHLPDGTTQTANVNPGQLFVAEDLANYGVAIGSNAGGPVYPVGLANISTLPSKAMDATPAPITGRQFICANFDPINNTTTHCAPVPINTDQGPLLVNQQFGGDCFPRCDPNKGFYAVVAAPTLFVDTGTLVGGTVSAAATPLSCPGTCSIGTSNVQEVLLTASPASGFSFVGWSGACHGHAPTCTAHVNGAVTYVEAQFAAVPATRPVASWISDAPSTGPNCVVTSDATQLCAGTFFSTALGILSSLPIPIAGTPTGVASSSDGDNVSCVVTQAGAAQCWGSVRNGTGTTPAPGPTTVTGFATDAVQVSARESVCALSTAGLVQCWGDNSFGQLGNGQASSASPASPVTPVGMETQFATAVAMSRQHACAIIKGGGVMCWGNNLTGQLGNGTFTTNYTANSVVGLPSPAVSITVGELHTCVLTSANGVWCWGDNTLAWISTKA